MHAGAAHFDKPAQIGSVVVSERQGIRHRFGVEISAPTLTIFVTCSSPAQARTVPELSSLTTLVNMG